MLLSSANTVADPGLCQGEAVSSKWGSGHGVPSAEKFSILLEIVHSKNFHYFSSWPNYRGLYKRVRCMGIKNRQLEY